MELLNSLLDGFNRLDVYLFHGGDGCAITGNAVTAPILFELFEDLLERMRLVPGQQVRQLGADVLVNDHFRNVFADQLGDALHVARRFFDDDQVVAGAVLLLQKQ